MATINDVAKQAGVSKSTVSSVFSKKRPISKEVSERVIKIANELNYKPNYLARSLVAKETRIIGINMQAEKTKFSQFHLALLNGVLKVCYERGYRLLVNTLHHDFTNRLEHVTSDFVDGEILLDPVGKDSRIAERLEQSLPLVVIGRPPKNMESKVSYVDNDNKETAKQVTKFLLSLGHRDIVFLNAQNMMTVSEDREAGFIDAYKEAALQHSTDYIVFKSQSTESTEYGYKETKRLLAANPNVTAIIADTGNVAHGVYQAAAEMNIRIPDQLSVFSFGETPGHSPEFPTPLSIVRLNAEILGEEAAKLLLDQVASRSRIIKRVTIPTEITARGSCAPVR